MGINKRALIAILVVFVIMAALIAVFTIISITGGGEKQKPSAAEQLQQMQENAQYALDNAPTETTTAPQEDFTYTTTLYDDTEASGGSFDAGYAAGYQAGLIDGEAQEREASDLAAEQAYEEGYRDGRSEAGGNPDEAPPAGGANTSGGEDASAEKTRTVTLSGAFTATVRAVLPDFVTDSETVRAAVIQLSGESLFVMHIQPEVCTLLQADETYRFLLDEQSAEIPVSLLNADGTVSEEILKTQDIAVGSVRAPYPDENGLDAIALKYN